MTRVRRAARAGVVLVLTLAATLAIATAAAPPQAAASFAGRWVLVAAKPVRPGYDQFWLGTEMRITQTATTVEIARLAPAPERTARFVIGKETQNVYVLDGRRVERDSRATLRDGLLLISTDLTTDTAPRRLANILRWTMEPDGTLTVMDTEICGKGECPSIITTLAFRQEGM